MRGLRHLCLVCFGILLTAVAIGILDILLLTIDGGRALKLIGCAPGNILPHIECFSGPFRQVLGFVLNLPVLFILVPTSTLGLILNPAPSAFPWFMYVFDAILVLGVAYPVLALSARRRARNLAVDKCRASPQGE